MRGLLNYAGASLLILTGISLCSWDSNLQVAETSTLASQLIAAGLVWAGLALNGPLRDRGHRGASAGLPRAGPARGPGHRRHRVSRRVAARFFVGREGRGLAADASSAVAGGSSLKNAFRAGAREARLNLCSARASMWAVLSAIVLNLTSSELLFADEGLPRPEHGEALYTVVSVAVCMGLLVAGVFAADPVSGEKGRATPAGAPPAPAKGGASLFGRVWGAMAVWLLIFVISAPHILVVGYGTGVPWTGLIYAFVLGALCAAGFVGLTVGIDVLSRSGRGVMLVSMTVLIAMAAPTLSDGVPQGGRLGNAYNALSPVAQARLSLERVIVEKETFLVQLPHIAALATFVVVAAVFVVFAARGASPVGVGWHGAREAPKLRDLLKPRPRTNEPARSPHDPKGG